MTTLVTGAAGLIGSDELRQGVRDGEVLGMLGDDFQMSRVERLKEGLAQLERHTRELQESVMRIRMVPISFSFSRFPRLVHDLSRKLGKKIELKMSGESTEVDKTVIEKIGDPLVHLVRNSLDHGIESPEERLAAGKPETGTVLLSASHRGGNIVIEIRDDGRGLPRDKILNKAIERGLAKADDNLSDKEVYDLIFQPGFSTAEKVTDISGRGVGMDVVKRGLEAMRGRVDVNSKPGVGTTFTIRLPLTMAIGSTLAAGSLQAAMACRACGARKSLNTSVVAPPISTPTMLRSRVRAISWMMLPTAPGVGMIGTSVQDISLS